MPTFFGVIVIAVLAVLSVALLGIWGLPFSLLIGAAFLAYLVVARQRNGAVGTIERGAPIEPTGMPRKSPGGAETANERMGQS